MLKIIYHGHSCFTLENESCNVIIDPFISGNPMADIEAKNVNPTHILVTHGHGDHLGDAIDISKRTNAVIIAPNELALYCQYKGATVHRMHIGGARTFDFGWVKLTPAWHGSAVTEDENIIYTGNPCGFIIKIDGFYIYHAGDTGLFGDMKLIGDMYPLDCALLPIGDNYVMGPEDALIAAGMLNAKVVVPMHYNTFSVIEQDADLFAKHLISHYPSQQVKVMKPGESYVFER